MDEFLAMQKADQAGEAYDYSAGIRKAFIPSTFRLAVGAAAAAVSEAPVIGPAAQWIGRGMNPEMERFARATNNPEQQSNVWEFVAKQMLGLGWQHIKSEQSMDWYVQGVEQELIKQSDIYYDKRARDLTDTAIRSGMPAPELEAKLEELKYKIKDMKKAFKTAAKQAKYDWKDANSRENTRAVERAQGTTIDMRQEAAKRKLGGAK